MGLEQELIWHKNVGRLEALIKLLVSRPRRHTEVPSLRHARALYPGSSVSLDSIEGLENETEDKDFSHQIQTPSLTARDIPGDLEALIELIKEDGGRVADLISSIRRREKLGFVSYML